MANDEDQNESISFSEFLRMDHLSDATADENAGRAGGKRAQAGDDVTADLSLSGAAAQIAGVAGGAPFSPEPLAAL